MSEVVRSMSRSERYSTVPAQSRQDGRFRFTRWLLLFFVALGVYAYWISRDTHDIRQFVGTDPGAIIVTRSVLENRAEVFNSASWSMLSEEARAHPLPTVFATEFGAPDWVLRNLFGQYVLTTTPMGSDYTDAVYMSKMSPFGVLIERAMRQSSGIQKDRAGGLYLQYLTNHELYYAVRGRLVIASLSRRALIHALTLGSDEQIPEDAWDDSILNAGGEDVRGTIRLSEDSRWGSYFAGIGFALRVDSDEAVLKLKLPCTDTFYSELVPTLDGKGPVSLLSPEPGPIRFSADIGASHNDTFALIADVLDVSEDVEEPWLIGLLSDTPVNPISELLDNSGTNVSRTWHGYAVDDIEPAHVTSTLLLNNGDAVSSAIASAPESLSGEFKEESYRRDPEFGWLEVLRVGGPSLTRVIALDGTGRHILTSSSRTQAEANGWGTDRSVSTRSNSETLYVAIDPGAVITEYETWVAAMEAGFAFTPDEAMSHAKNAARWRAQMRGVNQIELTAEHLNESKTIQATLTVR